MVNIGHILKIETSLLESSRLSLKDRLENVRNGADDEKICIYFFIFVVIFSGSGTHFESHVR